MNLQEVEKCAQEIILHSLRDSEFLHMYGLRFSYCSHHIGDALEKISDAFNDCFQKIFSVTYLRRLDAEEFPSYALPICLNLCRVPTYFNILLACSFLIEIVTYLSDKHLCYKFLDAAKKCLMVIIHNKLKLTEGAERWNTFVSFCEVINAKFTLLSTFHEPIDLLCPNPVHKAYVQEWIHSCTLVNEHSHLTSAESAILSSDDTFDRERENPEPPEPCNFCLKPCQLIASISVKTHIMNRFAINVDALHSMMRVQ